MKTTLFCLLFFLTCWNYALAQLGLNTNLTIQNQPVLDGRAKLAVQDSAGGTRVYVKVKNRPPLFLQNNLDLVPNVNATIRQNHSGEQPLSSVTGLLDSLEKRVATFINLTPVVKIYGVGEVVEGRLIKSITNGVIKARTLSTWLQDSRFAPMIRFFETDSTLLPYVNLVPVWESLRTDYFVARRTVVTANLATISAWVPVDASFSFLSQRADATGQVLLRGKLRDGPNTAGTVLGTLPTLMRPLQTQYFPIVTSHGIGSVTVETGGSIIYQNVVAGATWIALDSISFFGSLTNQ